MLWKFATSTAAACIVTIAMLASADARPNLKAGSIKSGYVGHCAYGHLNSRGQCRGGHEVGPSVKPNGKNCHGHRCYPRR